MRNELRRLRRNRLTVIGTTLTLLVLAMALLANRIAPYDPTELNARHRLEAPSADFRFGTDRLGRDVLSRVVYGARGSRGIAASLLSLCLVLGLVVGLLAGYFGGGLDLVIGRVMDVLFSFPALLLAIAIAAMLGPGVRNTALAIAVVYTPLFARVIRGPVISERHRDYVQAARVIGASHAAIIWRHILPNVASPIIIQASAALSAAILIEAALSYVGLGTAPPAPSWGRMMYEGRVYYRTAPWLALAPGVAILIAVVAFHLLGEGLRARLDPKEAR